MFTLLKITAFALLFACALADDHSTEEQSETTTTENPVLAELGQFRSDLRVSFDAAKNNGHEGKANKYSAMLANHYL